MADKDKPTMRDLIDIVDAGNAPDQNASNPKTPDPVPGKDLIKRTFLGDYFENEGAEIGTGEADPPADSGASGNGTP